MDSRIQREPERAETDRVIAAAFPEWKSYETTLLSGGLFNTAYILKEIPEPEDGHKYVLRFGPVMRELLLPYEHNLMAAEAWAYEKMAAAGVPTSHVVYLDTSKALLDRDVMIVEYIPSVNLYDAKLDDANKAIAYEEVGRLTRKMHEIPGTQFGRAAWLLRGRGFDRWSDYIRSEFDEWADSIRHKTTGFFTEEELSAILALPGKYRTELDEITEPRFCHCDLWGLNVLMKEKGSPEVAAVIDPDRCCMGDPDFELASGWMMSDAFYRGYGRSINEDDPATEKRVTLYRALFFLLDGFFQRVQYDDPKPSLNDKEWAYKHLDKLF